MKPIDLVKTELDEKESNEIIDNINEIDEEIENIDESNEVNDDLDETEDVKDEDFKVKNSDETKKKSVKKRPQKTCEKCHKTYNTQTQFRIHQRVRKYFRILENTYAAEFPKISFIYIF